MRICLLPKGLKTIKMDASTRTAYLWLLLPIFSMGFKINGDYILFRRNITIVSFFFLHKVTVECILKANTHTQV